jgi:ribonuclease HI
VVESFGRYLGHATNNQAEYKAVLFALEAARKYQPQEIEFRLDSELVVRQLIGQYKVKNLELKAIYDQILDAIKPYKTSFSHVYRADNKLADKQVNLAIDANLKNRPI